MAIRRMWTALILLTILSFGVVIYVGQQIYISAPPIPEQVVTNDNQILFTKSDISRGQAIWQSIGGQELGTIWGHGAYLAPDWTADWLHREAINILDGWSNDEFGLDYEKLDNESQAKLRARLQEQLRTNTYDPSTGNLILSPIIAKAVKQNIEYFSDLFGNNPNLDELREHYSMPLNVVETEEDRKALTTFFFWASWACVTNRPGQTISYTNNWPAERLVGNTPSPLLMIISIVSVVLLLAGIALLGLYYAFFLRGGFHDLQPAKAPTIIETPSMKAIHKFFFVIAFMMLLQIGFGVITAHYTVEGTSFFGFPLSKWLPYTLTRTWHLQLAIFWIATALLSTAMYVAPLILGSEPKFQRLGVNFIFWTSIVLVGGSMMGEYLAINHQMPLSLNFWFGHQGYEYIDLGRFWQIILFLGLLLWLTLMLRAVFPAIKKRQENFHLLILFAITSTIIGIFYGFGLLWGENTHLSIVEYWRWWVVHLWVEGFFEVYSTVIVAYLFTRLGLIDVATATKASLLTTIIYLFGGVIGIFHHMYFTGTPSITASLGGIFGALEVVPLALIGFEAYHNYKLSRAEPWIVDYKWPIYFFIAMCFWNLVGAGLFGFLINMPIALYYLQGLNTTPLHSHGALFGVYGNLSIGLILFCLRGLTQGKIWNNKLIALTFWLLNIGLAEMCFLSLLPIGLIQSWFSINYDMWYARSTAFTQLPLIHDIIWIRAFGDTLFGLGALAFIVFIFQVSFSKAARVNL